MHTYTYIYTLKTNIRISNLIPVRNQNFSLEFCRDHITCFNRTGCNQVTYQSSSTSDTEVSSLKYIPAATTCSSEMCSARKENGTSREKRNIHFFIIIPR